MADVDGDGSYDLWVGSGGADVRILSNSYRDPLGLPADVPRDLRLVAAATSGIEIEWDAPPFAATARHYRVYRATSAGLHHTDMRWIGTVGNVHQDEGLSQPL
ncbi:MAG: hypothetical protein GWO04_37335, partial [Actinobacteria bacterium]|nr:hypothetical protein [Actinomycetota bacterium]